MRGSRRIGSPFTGNGMGSTTMASLGSLRVHENRVTKRWMIIRISMRANSLPGHILGPLLNGTNVKGAGPAPSKRDGLNLWGSGKYLGFLWVEWGDHIICVQKKCMDQMLFGAVFHEKSQRNKSSNNCGFLGHYIFNKRVLFTNPWFCVFYLDLICGQQRDIPSMISGS